VKPAKKVVAARKSGYFCTSDITRRRSKHPYVVVIQIKSGREVTMNRKWILIICIANLCALADGAAVAAVIHYTLNNVNFQAPVGPPPPNPIPPGYPPQPIGGDGSAVGTFDYDTNSQQISNISITTTSTPGTLACYEPNPCVGVVSYTGSNYISSVLTSGGATAHLVADPSNGNNQQILFQSNAGGGGSVYVYLPGGGHSTTACYPISNTGCTLSLTIPINSLNAGGAIQLVSGIQNGTQTAPGSADPTGVGVCGTEAFVGSSGISSKFVRYVFSTPTCGYILGTTSGGNGGTSSAGGGLTAFATFALLLAAYMLVRLRLGRRRAAA
jgi:hypothetical protein